VSIPILGSAHLARYLTWGGLHFWRGVYLGNFLKIHLGEFIRYLWDQINFPICDRGILENILEVLLGCQELRNISLGCHKIQILTIKKKNWSSWDRISGFLWPGVHWGISFLGHLVLQQDDGGSGIPFWCSLVLYHSGRNWSLRITNQNKLWMIGKNSNHGKKLFWKRETFLRMSEPFRSNKIWNYD
jgi:hypothetical protein